jgi:hypothetical protein
MQIRKVRRSTIHASRRSKENSVSSFQTVDNNGERHCVVIKVGPRSVYVFHEMKISETEISSFFKL